MFDIARYANRLPRSAAQTMSFATVLQGRPCGLAKCCSFAFSVTEAAVDFALLGSARQCSSQQAPHQRRSPDNYLFGAVNWSCVFAVLQFSTRPTTPAATLHVLGDLPQQSSHGPPFFLADPAGSSTHIRGMRCVMLD